MPHDPAASDLPTSPSGRPHVGTSTPADPSLARRAAIASGVGTLIEYYDFAIYGYLSIVMAQLFFPSDNRMTSLLIALAVFGTSYVVRPLGGIIIGHLGDTRGRRFALILSVSVMGAASTLMGALPTAEQIGIWAAVLLVTLRLVQGLSAGGEIGGAAAIVAESSPPAKRSLYAAAPGMGGNGGFALAAAMVGALTLVTSPEQMSDWGWRIPFLLSLPLTVLSLWARTRIPETEIPRPAGETKPRALPIVLVFNRDWRNLLMGIGISVAGLGTAYVTLSYISIHMLEMIGYDSSLVYWTTTVVITISVLTMPFFGRFADRVGFMRVAAVTMILYVLLSFPTLALIGTGNFVVAGIIYLVFALLLAPMQVAAFSIYPRLFRADTRVSGVSMAYNLGSILSGGTAPFICAWLVSTTGNVNAPAAFVAVVAIVGLIALRSVSRSTQFEPSLVARDDQPAADQLPVGAER